MTECERIRKKLDVSRAEFARRYHIPIRTLEEWEKGTNKPPAYVMELLDKAVKVDLDAKNPTVVDRAFNVLSNAEKVEDGWLIKGRDEGREALDVALIILNLLLSGTE